MILVLVLVAQLCSVIHGSGDESKYITSVKLNATCHFDKVQVTENMAVLASCVLFCAPSFLNWSVMPDQTLCNNDPAGFKPPVPVMNTGKCRNGACIVPDREATRGKKIYPVCFDYDKVKHNGEEIAAECKKSCYVNENKHYPEDVNLENGVKCVFEKKSYLWGIYERVTKVGTCQNGKCSNQLPTPEACPRDKLLVGKLVSVDEKCNVSCKNGSTVSLGNGTMCALRARRPWWTLWLGKKRLQEIGVCQQGECVEREAISAPPHQSKKGCNGTDITINEKLRLASNCRAQCEDGTFEQRADSTPCLWRYQRHDNLDIFRVGFCLNGYCEPRENGVVVTEHTFKPK